jgi:hypothetical protein
MRQQCRHISALSGSPAPSTTILRPPQWSDASKIATSWVCLSSVLLRRELDLPFALPVIYVSPPIDVNCGIRTKLQSHFSSVTSFDLSRNPHRSHWAGCIIMQGYVLLIFMSDFTYLFIWWKKAKKGHTSDGNVLLLNLIIYLNH